MVALRSGAEHANGATSRFSCRSVPMRDCVLVVPTGELDIASVPHLDRSLRLAADAHHDVVLDLRELDFIDSSGGHLLIAAHRRIGRSGGRLLVVRASGEVAWLMRLLGIDRELELIEPPAGAPTVLPAPR